MPPKEKGKKGGGKALQAAAQLNALQTTFKAACRAHGVPLHKGIAAQIDEAILEGTAIDKISLTGPDTEAGFVKAACDIMAGYPAVKNLACWGCSLGDEGVLAIAQLLRASSDRWWRGSKLKLLEVVSDGVGTPLDKWPERYLEHMRGGLEVQGKGHAMPSLLQGQTEPVTDHTLNLQQAGLPPPSAERLAAELRRMCAVAGPITTLTYSGLEDATAREAQLAAERAASGYLPAPPAPWKGLPPPVVDHITISALPSMSHNSPDPNSPAGVLRSFSSLTHGEAAIAEEAAPNPAAGAGTTQVVEPTLSRTPSLVRSPSPTTHGADTVTTTPAAHASPHPAHGKSRLGGGLGGVTASMAAPAPGSRTESPALGASHADMSRALAYPPAPVQPSFSLAASGPEFLAQGPLPSLRPMAFSAAALQQLSLGLGIKGITLQVLVLDHNSLGDLGALTLAAGLARCASLKQLSMSDCGIASVGAAALGAALTSPAGATPDAPSLVPKLVALNLSRNPLGGGGLTALCPGLAACTTLKVLHLAAVGLTEADVPALGAFADTLAANTSIDQVDLDANFFGDPGAAALIPFLSNAKHMRKFRITARDMTRAVGGQVGELVRANFPKKAMKKKAAKKK